MATFKAEVQNKREDGTYNVRIRITHNRNVRRLSTNLYVTAEDLTRGLKIKNASVLDKCEDIIRKCRSYCNNLGYTINSLTVDELKDKLKTHLEGGERFSLDFIAYAEKSIAKKVEKTGRPYRSAINALIRFLKRDQLDIAEINSKFLANFKSFLESEPSQKGNNRKGPKKDGTAKKTRAISSYLGSLRTIHNEAKKEYNDEENGIIRITQSPFKNFKVPPQPKTRKRALSVNKIQKIIDLPYNDNYLRNQAKDCFILSFALIGMNSADMYAVGPAKKGMLIYNRAKTKDRREDNAEMRVLIESCIDQLLLKYKDGARLFDFHKKYAHPDNFNKALNEGLKFIGAEIGEANLQFGNARHSWATIARSAQVGVDKATVHEALNHVDHNMKVTDIYIDRDWSLIWNANKKVLALFDWSAVGYDLL